MVERDQPWRDRTSDATWREVDRLFAAALERPRSERRAWLETSAPDPRVAHEVMLLVEEAEASGLPLDSRDDGWLRGLWENLSLPDEDPLLGTRLGAFRIVRRLGGGGMGSVYLAEREGDEFEQSVAVKVLRPGLEATESLTRFRSERRILASLDHPNIGTLLDGGTVPDGRPYLVMEYVEGERITDHVRDGDLGLDEVLRLVLTVADAVEHAHRHLVVHRDLKPSNILVRPDGVVKLLDFGIARLIDGESAHATTTGSRVMTPAYAAPEQFTGEAVTTATDVYQLGVLLYELLTDEPPFSRSGDARDLERRILGDTADRPSEVIARGSGSRTGWARRVRGDLDTIVAKALRKEPERRYRSAGSLADDLRAFLDRRPVSARPDTLGYRLRSAARRHPWLLPAAATAVLAVSIYVATLVRYTRSLEHERAVSAEVETFLLDLFRPADPRRTDGANLTARELVQAGAVRLREDLADQPEIQVRVAQVMGDAFTALSDFDAALDVLRLRLDRVEELEGEEGEEYANALTDYGVAVANAGDPAAADSLFTRALDLRQQVLDPLDARIGWTLLQRARARTVIGDHEGAEADLDAWLPIYRASPPDPDPGYLGAISDLYWTRLAQGRRDEAIELAHSGLELARRGYPDSNPLVAAQQGLVMNAYYQEGRNEEAVEIGTRALRTMEAAYGEEGTSGMVDLITQLGVSHKELGHLDTAAVLFERSVALQTRLSGTESPSLLQPLGGLAEIFLELGRFEEAYEAEERAMMLAASLMGGPNAVSGFHAVGLGEIAEAQGDTAAALDLYRSGLDQLEGSRGWRPAKVTARRRLAAAERRAGRPERALGHLEDALAVAEADGDEALLRSVLQDLVTLYEEWGRSDEAGDYRARLASLEAGRG